MNTVIVLFIEYKAVVTQGIGPHRNTSTRRLLDGVHIVPIARLLRAAFAASLCHAACCLFSLPVGAPWHFASYLLICLSDLPLLSEFIEFLRSRADVLETTQANRSDKPEHKVVFHKDSRNEEREEESSAAASSASAGPPQDVYAIDEPSAREACGARGAGCARAADAPCPHTHDSDT
ncbi:hypothetical protein ACJJTC_005061 [Scirpophaga incertulas]